MPGSSEIGNKLVDCLAPAVITAETDSHWCFPIQRIGTIEETASPESQPGSGEEFVQSVPVPGSGVAYGGKSRSSTRRCLPRSKLRAKTEELEPAHTALCAQETLAGGDLEPTAETSSNARGIIFSAR